MPDMGSLTWELKAFLNSVISKKGNHCPELTTKLLYMSKIKPLESAICVSNIGESEMLLKGPEIVLKKPNGLSQYFYHILIGHTSTLSCSQSPQMDASFLLSYLFCRIWRR